MKKLPVILSCLSAVLTSSVCGMSVEPEGCYGRLEGDTLRIGNRLIERKFIWNGGNIITYSLTEKTSGRRLLNRAGTPDFRISGTTEAASGVFSSQTVAATEIHPEYLEASVSFSLGGLDVKRVYRVYEDCAAIACDTYLRGNAEPVTDTKTENHADRKNIESTGDMRLHGASAVLDQLKFDGLHWQTRIVEFHDVTDWNNNLVFETDIIPYRRTDYRGNLLFAGNAENGTGIFFLKESPSGGAQIAYGGHDFTVDFGHFTVTGTGIAGKDIVGDEWRKTYGCVTGIYTGTERERLSALRSYQKNLRRHLPSRDDMVMMNTWGDRSQDSRVNEEFCLAELECAARLGITRFQIDDGWQSGRSPNSAVAKGSFADIWDNPDYWTPDPQKYPHGLGPIVERGRELGVEVCLWFNPSVQDDYADWQKDAQAIISLYNEYGIRTFKIDGLSIPTKQSEINLRRLFDRVLEQTDNKVVFNLDATAGRRGGYHTFNEYGNIFLENRYTDWQNYYPYWTLRNLWQLSKYVPAERLQIEFLNKWRNGGKYGNDPFAPTNYSFEYLFAVTIPGQPLAWFEGTGLPEEAFTLGEQIAVYKEISGDFHRGVILPVGEEPSGRSWTGFQSILDEGGYFIFYREDTPRDRESIETWLPEGAKVKLTPVMGGGRSVSRTAGRRGALTIELPHKNSFAVYRYRIIN